MTDNFYRAFEEKYRGSRELIKSRLTAYQPFLGPVLGVYPEAQALDLGCGRGEWLEYITELGFSGHGVDRDDGMLSACAELELSAEKSDLLAYLRQVVSDSLGLVSAFHVVEHISFNDLKAFVAESLRALKPGGLLIMETPNPENIVVATREFYLDPTHQKPIPSELLSFVAEYAGFQRVKTMRLREASGLIDKADIGMADLLGGVSPDYGIVAQKSADPEVMATFDEAFNGSYGLGLETLTARFDCRLIEVEAKASEAEAKASEAEAKASEAEAKASEAEAKASEAEGNVNALINSRSWRITAPLRAISSVSRKRVPKPAIRRRVTLFLQHASLYIQRRPRLKRVVLRLINRFPRLKNRIFNLVRPQTVARDGGYHEASVEFENLTPHARRIYQNLKSAIEKNRERK